MSTREQPPKRGRPPETGEARSEVIRVRATPAEVEQFEELGGADWFRRALRAAAARLRRREGKPSK